MSALNSVEMDGQAWVYATKTVPDEKHPFAYSFDGGETWGTDMPAAYRTARDSGKLIPEISEEQKGLAEEVAAVTVELIALIRSLRPGESIKVSHIGSAIQVSKRRLALTFRPSALEGSGIEPSSEEE